MGKRVRDEDNTDDTNTRTERPKKDQQQEQPRSHERSGHKGKITNAKDIPAGMSSLEFLNSED